MADMKAAPAGATGPEKLLNWGFQNFDTVKLYSKGQAIATPEIWKGSKNTVKIGFASDGQQKKSPDAARLQNGVQAGVGDAMRAGHNGFGFEA